MSYPAGIELTVNGADGSETTCGRFVGSPPDEHAAAVSITATTTVHRRAPAIVMSPDARSPPTWARL